MQSCDPTGGEEGSARRSSTPFPAASKNLMFCVAWKPIICVTSLTSPPHLVEPGPGRPYRRRGLCLAPYPQPGAGG